MVLFHIPDSDESGQVPVVIQFIQWMDKKKTIEKASICLHLYKVWINKATWCWRVPTSLFFYINTDHDLWPWPLVTFDLEPFDLYLLIWFLVQSIRTDRWTDGRTDRQKVTHMSPPCKMHRWAQKSHMNFFLDTLFLVFVTDGRTDGQTDRQKAQHEHRWAQKPIIKMQLLVCLTWLLDYEV